MNNYIENKQITVDSIIKVADLLEGYRKEYLKKFEIDKEKNKELDYEKARYQYKMLQCNLMYRIEEKTGKTMSEDNYNWFVSYFNQAKKIKNISMHLGINFDTQINENAYDSIYNSISIWVDFSEQKVKIEIDTRNQESEAHRMYDNIVNILNDNKQRLDATIKHRNLRIQSFCISIGIILSYIIFVLLKINTENIPTMILELLENKNFLIPLQWIVSIFLGNLFARWIIIGIYKPILPDTRYGYNSFSNTYKYKDNINDFITGSEVHIGNYSDAIQRRDKIEKIYRVTRIIVLIQIIISGVMFFAF